MTMKPTSESVVLDAAQPDAPSNVIHFPVLRASNVLNWRELLSVKSMTAFVAHNQNVPEAKVRAFVEATFGVPSIAGLRRDDFERVIAFLVDLNCDMMTH